MPLWARPTDIAFDYAAADEAIESLETLNWWLTTGSEGENDSAITALSEWAGQAANNFRTTHSNNASDKALLAGQCLTLRDQLLDAKNDAYWAQVAVENQQDQWDRELLAELDAMSNEGVL